jgi:hypothetical protein
MSMKAWNKIVKAADNDAAVRGRERAWSGCMGWDARGR